MGVGVWVVAEAARRCEATDLPMSCGCGGWRAAVADMRISTQNRDPRLQGCQKVGGRGCEGVGAWGVGGSG